MKRGFRSIAALRLKKTLKMSAVSSHAGSAGERHFGTTFFRYIWLGLYTATSYATTFFQSCCKRWIYMLGFIYGSCMFRCSTTLSSCSSGILEQRVSRTIDRARWTKSMACSLPWFTSLILSLGTSEAYCLCYRSHWHSGLVTTNT